MSHAKPLRNLASRRTSRLGIVFLVFGLSLSAGVGHAFAQPAVRPAASSDDNVQARRWFKDAKLGLFIHWGVYSLVGKGEWVMDHDKLPISEYVKLPPRFNPTRFDAVAWVKLAKSAGA